MFRLAERDYGLTRRVLHLETGIPAETLKSWAHGTVIPLTGLRKLLRAIPDELTSLLLVGTGKVITGDGSDGDMDALVAATADFQAHYVAARSDKSPGGPTIIPMERERLKEKAARVCARSRAVAH